MEQIMNKFARIIGTGSYLPPKIVTNADLEKTLDTSDEWITSRTGIKQRHIAHNQSTTDLATIAANNALESAGISASDLDLIIVATTTPDKIFPAVATMVQHNIGANCPGFDLQAVCAGFIFALTTAEAYIKNGMNNILVIGSETMSNIIDWSDRNTAVLFGDGAGAVVLGSDANTGILHSQIFSDGSYLSSLQTTNTKINEQGFIAMAGNEVFKIAVNNLSNLAVRTLEETGLTGDDIDFMVPHQANIRIISAVAKKIKVPMERVILTVQKHGNTSAASIPLALDEGVKSGKIHKGHKLLFEGIGGGFSWGSVLVEF
jgi:3-oxoacyl-[acyl-carrier-protein] synthase-3